MRVRIRRMRAITAAKYVGGLLDAGAPYSSPFRMAANSRVVPMIALEGMEPALSELPPRRYRSISATLWPWRAADSAAANPAGPPPRTTKSYTLRGTGFLHEAGRTRRRRSSGSACSDLRAVTFIGI